MRTRRSTRFAATVALAAAMTVGCSNGDLAEDDVEEGPPTEGDEVVPGPEGPVD